MLRRGIFVGKWVWADYKKYFTNYLGIYICKGLESKQYSHYYHVKTQTSTDFLPSCAIPSPLYSNICASFGFHKTSNPIYVLGLSFSMFRLFVCSIQSIEQFSIWICGFNGRTMCMHIFSITKQRRKKRNCTCFTVRSSENLWRVLSLNKRFHINLLRNRYLFPVSVTFVQLLAFIFCTIWMAKKWSTKYFSSK